MTRTAESARVLIIDDHPLLRKGIRETIEEVGPGVVVGGEAPDAESALSLLAGAPFDLVILDLNLPGMHGFELLERLRVRWPTMPVIIVTINAEEQYALRAFKMGAAGFLPKDASAEQLIEAVRRVIAGGRYVTPELAEKLIFRADDAARPRHETLSNREFLVMKRLVDGRSPREIADEMAISVKTVGTYRARVLEKLECRTLADLVRYCVAHRLTGDNGRGP